MILFESVTSVLVEILVTVLLALLAVVSVKANKYISNLKAKDEFGMVEKIIDSLTSYADAELKGAKGAEKRDFVIDKAIEILGKKGIKVDKEEILMGIEKSVQKNKKV